MSKESVTKNTALIDLKGIEIEAVDENGMPFANLKRLCEALGLAYTGQLRNLKKKHWAVVNIMFTTGNDGKRYEMTFISADSIPMWLANIHESKVREELRPRLRVLQLEARDVLYAHFSGDVSVNGMLLSEIGSQIAKGIRDGLDTGLKPINEKIDNGFAEVDKNFVEVNRRIDKLEKRKPIPVKTRSRHQYIAKNFYSGKCPCCRKILIVNSVGEKLAACEFDHWDRPSEPGLTKTWPICVGCNSKLRNADFKKEKAPQFDAYQQCRRDFELALDGPYLSSEFKQVSSSVREAR